MYKVAALVAVIALVEVAKVTCPSATELIFDVVPAARALSVIVTAGEFRTNPLVLFDVKTASEYDVPIHIFSATPNPPDSTKLPVDDDVANVLDVTLIALFVVNDVPVSAMAPDVLVRFSAPVVNVNPFEAVNVSEEVSPPAMLCAVPEVLMIKLAAPPASGIV
jgi:hypothetical protein